MRNRQDRTGPWSLLLLGLANSIHSIIWGIFSMKIKLVLGAFAVALALSGCAKKEEAPAPEAAAPAAAPAPEAAAPAADAAAPAADAAAPAAGEAATPAPAPAPAK
jgi:predicted lipid-binding transport protein (Tim44 family)